MFARWNTLMRRHPLEWLTLIAVVPRLLAAFFSGGYFAQDDHFLVIEAAQSWVDGADYNKWLPWNQPGMPTPTGHMMLYPGLHFLLFWTWKWMGLTDPVWKMVLVRILHALWSLVTVRVGYRIALRLSSSPAIAWRCGLFLALFFFMPFVAVRNLVEVVSIPPLMWCGWWLIRRDGGPSLRDVFIAGLFAGLAIDLRFQTLFFGGGAGLALLLLRRPGAAAAFAAGLLVPVALVQGGIDLFIWGRPFAEMTEYVRYNLDNPTTYFDQPWYNYLLVIAGVFLPPFSLAVLFGFFKRPKPLLLWLPTFSFLVFHSLFPNKQERFILTILPLVFVLGYTTWEAWRERSAWWRRHVRLWNGVLAWTWTVNILLLVPLCFSYSKRERVEAMVMLRGSDVRGLVIEDTAEQDPPMMPLYYLGRWGIPQEAHVDSTADLRAVMAKYAPEGRPNTVLFIGEEELDRRTARVEQAIGPLTFVGKARPGLLDRIVHWLNPVNRNVTITIYRTGP